MAISIFFGLPGCGKSSVAVQTVVEESYKITMRQSHYKCVITNIPIVADNVFYCNDFSWIADGYVPFALLVIDEATLEFDSRDYKVFSKNLVRSFVLSRHTKNDLMLFCQIVNRVDKTIRDISDRVFFIKRGMIFKSLSYVYRVPYRIMFPDANSQNAGEIIMGYQKPGKISRLFAKRLWRPIIYNYYDTYFIPEGYEQYTGPALLDPTKGYDRFDDGRLIKHEYHSKPVKFFCKVFGIDLTPFVKDYNVSSSSSHTDDSEPSQADINDIYIDF